MRNAGLVLVACCLLGTLATGCRKEQPPAEPAKKPDSFATWPSDTIEKPEFLSAVERQAGHVRGDAEATRIPSTYQIPDWAEPTSMISAKGPKGAKVVFHLLPRSPQLKKQDDVRVESLLKGKKQMAETLVVARPWIGWYGQGTGVEAVSALKSQKYTLRVYTLFAQDLQLEVHVQWPTGEKEAFEEGQALLAHIVYSVKAAS